MRTFDPVLAVDYGLARVGLARTDETGALALPAGTLERSGDRRLAVLIARRAGELGARTVVIGLPLRDDDRETPVIEGARRLGRRLEREGLRVRFVDESLSSQEAEAAGARAGLGRREIEARRDELAATVILRRFLEEGSLGAPAGERA